MYMLSAKEIREINDQNILYDDMFYDNGSHLQSEKPT